MDGVEEEDSEPSLKKNVEESGQVETSRHASA